MLDRSGIPRREQIANNSFSEPQPIGGYRLDPKRGAKT
jgi:hypothetical protein